MITWKYRQISSIVDDTAKGGDIDLMTKLDILAQLHQKLGARKIDIAIYPDLSSPFSRMAMQMEVLLWYV